MQPDDAKDIMRNITQSLILKIFKTVLMTDTVTIKILGHGAFGVIYGDSNDYYVVKLSKLPILGDQSIVYCAYFKKEVYYKTLVYNKIQHLRTITTLSPLLYFDPGYYEEHNVCPDNNYSIKRCWIVLRRIVLSSVTEHKKSLRHLLYEGDITNEMMEIIRSVAQLYCAHFVLANLRVAGDLELVVGKCDGNFIVTFIDYGQVLPMCEPTHHLYKKKLKESILLMKRNIPILDENKFKIFRTAFIELAMLENKAKLANKILRMLSPKKKQKTS